MINEIWLILLALGFVIGAILDVLWKALKFDKKDKKIQWHEHYHVSIESLIVGIITGIPIFYGFSLALFIAEWRQNHPFAVGSGHFNSTMIVTIILLLFMYGVMVLV